MAAIVVHHTATIDETWDAVMMMGRLGSAPGEAKLRAMHAWMDPEGDAETKAAYKFPHHTCSMDGAVDAANLFACSSGIGSLNGSRGGSSIPDSDRQDVYNHLAAHLKDAKREPPELRGALPVDETVKSPRGNKAVLTEVQERTLPFANLHVRASNGGSPVIAGYAAVFDVASDPIGGLFGGFREIIKPGAFTRTLTNGTDVRALINHDPNYVLGRVKSGTLSLREDERGLWMEITPPDTQWARDLIETMRRGDIDQCSFAFIPVGKAIWDAYRESDGKETDLHVVKEARLYDVSVVTYPAYPQTSANVRQLLTEQPLNLETLTHAAEQISGELSLLQGALQRLRGDDINDTTSPVAPVLAEDHATERQDPPPSGHSLVDWSRLERLESLTQGERHDPGRDEGAPQRVN